MKVKITVIAHIFGKPNSDMHVDVGDKIRSFDWVDAIEDVDIKPVSKKKDK
jgi:hypothetical protein